MLVTKQEIETLLPHSGNMSLLDGVTSYSEKALSCIANSHLDNDNPLRTELGLSSVNTIELASQAMGLHSALLLSKKSGETKNQNGYIAKLKNIEIFSERLDTFQDALTIVVEQQMQMPTGLVYQFKVSCKDELISQGEIFIIVM